MIQDRGEGQEESSFAQAVISYKERYFWCRGEEYLLQSWHYRWFAQTSGLRGYEKVRLSWQEAIRKFVVPLPKGLSPGSAEEQEELEVFFLALRFWPLSKVSIQYGRLTDRWETNQVFLDAVANTIRYRRIPDETPLTLEHWLLCGWLHWSLWLLDNENRVIVLERIFGLQNVSVDRIRKAVTKLGLLDWSDFQPKFTPAPCYVELGTEDEQEWCQICPRSVGQK